MRRALGFFERACSEKLLDACVRLGELAVDQSAIDATRKRATKSLSSSCYAGYGEACASLGLVVGNRVGGREGQSLAITAAVACDAAGGENCALLGAAHSLIVGSSEAMKTAAKLFSKGCKLGSPTGCGELGVCYQHGWGVEQDVRRARRLYEQGCDGEYLLSCSNLGNLLAEGGPDDAARALALFKRSCEGEEPIGCVYMARHYDDAGKVAPAAVYLGKACELGETSACAMLASAAYGAYGDLRREAERQQDARKSRGHR